jgi:hypothetical protein
MSKGNKFKFRGETFRVIKVCTFTILAVNEDDPLESIGRFANLKIVK